MNDLLVTSLLLFHFGPWCSTEHLYSMKYNSSGLPVVTHFNSPDHSVVSARVSIVVTCADDTYRNTEEEHLIYKLGHWNQEL